MSAQMDLHDIQGNILKGYGREGFPKSRYVFYRILDCDAGRHFLEHIIPLVTTAGPWSRTRGGKKPNATTNVAFTYAGLESIGVPADSLRSFPTPFSMGMKARVDILGDDGASAPDRWDPIWREDEPVHLFVNINGKDEVEIDKRFREIDDFAQASKGGVALVSGHSAGAGTEDAEYQCGSAIYRDGKPTSTEHFGYVDGISNPYFKHSDAHPSNVIGGGKVTRGDPSKAEGWEPLETGEFLLGYKDEAFEYPEAPTPPLLGHNGCYVVYRKLHQNVGTFRRFMKEVGETFPGGEEALAAKFAGRWRNGAPVTSFPNQADADRFAADWAQAAADIRSSEGEEREKAKQRFSELNTQMVGFSYQKDADGSNCPMSAHVRRVNPRGALEYGKTGAFQTPGALTNRRRILRRGLPYGEVQDPERDDGNHGIIFMSLVSNIQRQFEFVQQQWINYGNDFRLGNDRDPLLGSHPMNKDGTGEGRMIIESKPGGGKPPSLVGGIPRFVETRGGDYFFLPSITALRMLAHGCVDPT